MKKSCKPSPASRGWAEYLINQYQVSEVRVCRVIGMSRSGFRYQAKKPDDEKIIELLTEIAERKPRWGFKKMNSYLKNQGYAWNHKKVYRVYCEMNLNLRKKT